MMTDSDLPGNGTATEAVEAPMSFDDGVSGIADMLDDPETDLGGPNEADDAEQPDGEGEDDDPFFSEPEGEAEDVDKDAAAENENGSQEEPEIKGGRFAPDTAKVTLDDGTVITVADLKRNNLFQRDYTKKTMELSEEVKSFEARKSEVDQYAQQLEQFAEFGEWLTQQFGIQDPGPYKGPANDPVAYYEHLQRKEHYDAIANGFTQFKQSKEQLTVSEREKAAKEAQARIKTEVEALHNAIPALKDQKKSDAFWSRMKEGAAEHYGLTPELVDSIGDHRMAIILRDALELKRLKSAAPKATEQVKGKPRIVTGSKRGNPNAQAQRGKQERAERLRKSGDFASGVASLMDFDL